MTLLGVPLAVRLRTALSDVFVSREVRDLSFRSVVPGGFATCEISLDRPLTLDPAEIQLYGDLFVYDGRSGATVWQGRLEDPGRSAGPSGEVWRVTAVGPAAHARDRTLPLMYVDRSLHFWGAHGVLSNQPAGDCQKITDPNNNPVLQMMARRPIVAAAGWLTGFLYSTPSILGLQLARIDYTWDAGVTDANWLIELVARPDVGVAGTLARSQAFNTAGGGSAAKVMVTDFPDGYDVLDLRMNRQVSTATIGDDNTWVQAGGLVVLYERFNKDGTAKTTGYATNTVLASEVVEDLLGRLLTEYDGANAVVTATSYAIEQLTYPDAITAERVFEDLMQLESGYYWSAWEETSTGKARFEWAAWPSTVRYEATAKDGLDCPGSAVDLYNAVTVRWVDALGQTRQSRRTQSVQVLTDAGLTREAFIDLGDELASSANADRVGDQFLLDHAFAPNAGTLQVSTPIVDFVEGRMVQPWEIRPGALIRVRDVKPSVDGLNATDRDAVTTFRVVGVNYDASRNQATLNLDSQPKSLQAIIARELGGGARRR